MKTNEKEKNVKERKIIPLVTKIDLEDKTWVLAQNGEWVPKAEIKPEYRDIPDDEWVSMDPMLLKRIGKRYTYMINKMCWIKRISNGKTPKIKIWKLEDYQNVGGYLKWNRFFVHILVAKIFLINPNNYKIVDHINGDPSRLSLENLRWASHSANSSNRKKSNWFFKKYDLKGNFIENIYYHTLSQSKRSYLLSIIRNKEGIGSKFKYELVNKLVEEYRKKFGDPDPSGWKYTKYPNVEINTRGYLRIKGKLTVGYKSSSGYYIISLTLSKRKYKKVYIHRLMLETFGNNIDTNFITDHKDTDTYNNTIENLIGGTFKSNSNNPITKRKLSKVVSQIDPKTFKIINKFPSIKDANKSFGGKGDIGSSIHYSGTLSYGFLWSFEGFEEEKIKEFKSSNYKFTFPDGFWDNEDNIRKFANNFKTVSEFQEKYPHGAAKAREKGILGELFNYKKPRRFTYELCFEVAKKFKTVTEFYKIEPNIFNKVKKTGWIKDYTWIEEGRKPRGYWNEKTAKAEAKNYETASEFRKSSSTAYRILRDLGKLNEFFPEYVIPQTTPRGFLDKEEVREERARQCKNRNEYSKKYSKSYEKSRKNKGELDKLFPKKSEEEKKEEIRLLASSCKDFSEFRKNFTTQYNYATRKRWISELFPNKRTIKPSGWWLIKEHRKEAANSCKTKLEYEKRFGAAYKISRTTEGELVEFFPNSRKELPKNWWKDKEHRLEAAKRCIDRNQYCKDFPGAYNTSLKIDNEIDELFPRIRIPASWWKDKEHRLEVAKKCSSRHDYQSKYRNAWEVSKTIPGELKEFFPLSKETKPLQWWKDKEHRLEAAKQCKNRAEYKQKFVRAYEVSLSISGELVEFFGRGLRKISSNYWKLKEHRKTAAETCRSRYEYSKKYSQAYKISNKLNELDEFFPSKLINQKENEKD